MTSHCAMVKTSLSGTRKPTESIMRTFWAAILKEQGSQRDRSGSMSDERFSGGRPKKFSNWPSLVRLIFTVTVLPLTSVLIPPRKLKA